MTEFFQSGFECVKIEIVMKNAGASVVGKDNAREFNLPFFTNALIISCRIIVADSVSKAVRSRGKETLRTKHSGMEKLASRHSHKVENIGAEPISATKLNLLN